MRARDLKCCVIAVANETLLTRRVRLVDKTLKPLRASSLVVSYYYAVTLRGHLWATHHHFLVLLFFSLLFFFPLLAFFFYFFPSVSFSLLPRLQYKKLFSSRKRENQRNLGRRTDKPVAVTKRSTKTKTDYRPFIFHCVTREFPKSNLFAY